MQAFDYVLILLSFIYALALGHLLSRIGSLLLAAERVVFSPLAILMAANAAWTLFFCWLGLWGLHTMAHWDIASIFAQFIFAITLFFICVFAAPEAAANEPIDTEAFYWKQHRRFYWAYIVASTAGIACNTIFLKSGDPSLFLKWNLASLPMYLPCILALAVRARWAQWTAGLGLLLVTTVAVVPLESTLG
jgi:hypothetical protein